MIALDKSMGIENGTASPCSIILRSFASLSPIPSFENYKTNFNSNLPVDEWINVIEIGHKVYVGVFNESSKHTISWTGSHHVHTESYEEERGEQSAIQWQTKRTQTPS